MAFVLNRGIFILWMLIIPVLSAEEIPVKDQGVFGTLFDIAEEDMIEMLKGKLQKLKESGQLAAIETSLKQKAKEKLETPPPVQGGVLPKASFGAKLVFRSLFLLVFLKFR